MIGHQLASKTTSADMWHNCNYHVETSASVQVSSAASVLESSGFVCVHLVSLRKWSTFKWNAAIRRSQKFQKNDKPWKLLSKTAWTWEFQDWFLVQTNKDVIVYRKCKVYLTGHDLTFSVETVYSKVCLSMTSCLIYFAQYTFYTKTVWAWKDFAASLIQAWNYNLDFQSEPWKARAKPLLSRLFLVNQFAQLTLTLYSIIYLHFLNFKLLVQCFSRSSNSNRTQKIRSQEYS